MTIAKVVRSRPDRFSWRVAYSLDVSVWDPETDGRSKPPEAIAEIHLFKGRDCRQRSLAKLLDIVKATSAKLGVQPKSITREDLIVSTFEVAP